MATGFATKGGGSSGSSGNPSLNYYGTLIGPCGWGPWDWLSGVVANGNYVFKSNLSLTADVTDLTGSLLDPTMIAQGGYLKFYRGTETQPADAAAVGHPPMKGTAYLIAKHIFFGQNSGTAPNLQVIGGGLPRVDTSIVAAVDNVADDGQINPVAAWAEILLDERGCGFPLAELDAASWLASAHWAYLNRAYCFCSPLITAQTKAREIARSLLDPFDGFCRRNKAGKLECKIYEWGIDPGGLQLLDARHWLRKPKLNLGDWPDVPTEINVKFTDRDFEYQENYVTVPNPVAAMIRQVDDPKGLDRSNITRIAQAHRHGTEYNRRISSAPARDTIGVSSAFISGLLPGDKIRIDTDPEPGGGGLSQLARIKQIDQDKSDDATITVETDNLLAATPYVPSWTAPAITPEVSPPLVNFIAVPLPPAAFDGMPVAVGILATRPSAAVVGMEVFFSDLHTNPFDELGTQIGFAARATLAANINNSVTTIQLTETDGLSGPEAGLASNTPGGNAAATANNTLLALLVSLDGNGRIALDGSGDPIMEFVSIASRTIVAGATFSYTVLRGRMDTPALAWTTGALAWIFPRVNLLEWRHELFDGLAGAPAFFRLVSYTSRATDESVTVPECSVNMLPTTSPMYIRGLATANLYFDFRFQHHSGVPATPTGDNPSGWFDGPGGLAPEIYMTRGVKRLDTGALQGTWSTPIRIDGVNGVDGDGLEVEWSVDGVTGWHYPFASGDLYFHERLGSSGAWSAAIKAVGEDGTNGTNGGSVLGHSGGGGTRNSTTYGAVSGTPIQVTVTCDGNPRIVTLSNGAYIANASGASNATVYAALYRDSTLICELNNGAGIPGLAPSEQFDLSLTGVDTPSAGSHTFYLYVKGANQVAAGAEIVVQ